MLRNGPIIFEYPKPSHKFHPQPEKMFQYRKIYKEKIGTDLSQVDNIYL